VIGIFGFGGAASEISHGENYASSPSFLNFVFLIVVFVLESVEGVLVVLRSLSLKYPPVQMSDF
jgi:hypothetical protein